MTSNADPVVSAPMGASAIREIERLTREGTVPAVYDIASPGERGLPEKMWAAWDAKAQAFKSVKPLLEEWRTAPERRRGTAVTQTLGSFIDLVNRHKDDDSALFFDASGRKPRLAAVIDYHTQAHEPRFCEHRVAYEFPISEALTAWRTQNGKPMTQADFALFLEDRLPEIASPLDAEVAEARRLFGESVGAGADLARLARELDLRVGQQVKQGMRLKSGERTLVFTETHANPNGEPVEVPGVFIVGVPAFEEGEPRRFTARLRYKVTAGGVMFSYHLWQVDQMLREAVRQAATDAAKATELPAFEGWPEE